MTDIRRHLPSVLNCLRHHLARQSPVEEMRNALHELLPASYLIGNGRLIDTKGQESPYIDIILCDKTISSSAQHEAHYDLRQALLTIVILPSVDRDTLGMALERMAQMKAMHAITTKSPPKQGHRQQPGRIPKTQLPLGLLGIGQFQSERAHQQNSDEGISLLLDRALKLQPAVLRPDYVLLQNQCLTYRHPLFDNRSFLGGTINITREPELTKPRLCYGCLTKFARRHFFYERLCVACGDLNYQKRKQSGNLNGRVALVTGGRIKIGYATALCLLRAGASVIVTTRFPHDAARRYSNEPDFPVWRDRLVIYGLDFRRLPVLEQFVEHLHARYHALDILINNAAQTVQRPLSHYRQLLAGEQMPLGSLPLEQQLLVQTTHQVLPSVQFDTLASDLLHSPSNESAPVTKQQDQMQTYEEYGQESNSWQLRVDEISVNEFLEVQVINVTAPFLLVSQLLPLMQRSSFTQRFVVNVSAVEGRFAQKKMGTHAHTNMAKAALNMLTHTAAADLAAQGVYMNSVDPGWVSLQLLSSEIALDEEGPVLPLDMLDAAARVCDPVFTGIAEEQPASGQFYRHYRSVAW